MLPDFKFFDHPELFSVFVAGETPCDMCGQTKHCFDATAFYGEDSIEAICPECLASGRLQERDIFTCEGDMAELIRQLQLLYPEQPVAAIEKKAREKTAYLEKTTPKLITWQEWSWPCSDGGYCTFVGFGSHALYNSLAEGNDGQWLFPKSLYHTVKDVGDWEELWEEALPAKAIPDFEASRGFGTLFYVFRNKESGEVVTVWDAA